MNKREAIELLKPFRNSMVDQYGCPISDVVFALDLAVEALGEPTVSEKESVEGDAETATTTNQKQFTGKLKNPDDSLLTADSDECKEQKSKLDCISRQQAIDEVSEEPFALFYDDDMEQDELVDTIVEQTIRSVQRRLESLPPVNQKQFTGKLESAENLTEKADESTTGQPTSQNLAKPNNCGAKMGGDTE